MIALAAVICHKAAKESKDIHFMKKKNNGALYHTSTPFGGGRGGLPAFGDRHARNLVRVASRADGLIIGDEAFIGVPFWVAQDPPNSCSGE
jgi:hypothetical protein